MNRLVSVARGCFAMLGSWLRAMTRRNELEAEMEAELAAHLEARTADLIRAGCSPDEAARRARVELGPALMHKENMRASVGLRWIDELVADLRYAVRMLRKSPGFTAVAVISLGLGIGANTTVFTVAQHMLLDRLGVPHPEQLKLLYWREPKDGIVEDMWGNFDSPPGGGEISTSFSYPVYEQMRRENHSLVDVAAFKPYGRVTVTMRGEAEAVEAQMVSGNFYRVFEVAPQIGRGIQESDDEGSGSLPVVTISDRFWAKQFGRSPDMIGKSILVDTTPMTVVGVNPRGFTGADSAQGSPDIFFPLSLQPVVLPQSFDPAGSPSLLTNKSLWWVLMMGRVKPGVPLERAEASLNVTLHAAVRATMPVKSDSQVPRLELRDGSRGENPSSSGLAKPVSVLMCLSGLVLLLACANLANLLLARSTARQREIGIRLAIGATRRRVLRQVMTESLLISLIGGATGLLLAWTTRNVPPKLLANSWGPPAFSASFSWPIFGFAAALSILTGLIFGLAPAWQAMQVQLNATLKNSGQTLTRRRRGLAGKAIVTLQIALSLLLVVGAGLFARTLTQLGRSPLGFRTHNLLLFNVELPETRYPKDTSTAVLRRIEEKLQAVPGVESATLTRVPLMAGNVMFRPFIPEGQRRKPEGNPTVLVNQVGERFFATFRIPIVAGRGFDARDLKTADAVAVISAGLAEKYFPHANPVGKTFETGSPDHPQTVRIVGICADAKYYRVRESAEPTFYQPFSQESGGIHFVTFAVAMRSGGQASLASFRRAVREVDPNLPLLDVRTQEEQVAANLRQERIFALLTSGFGVLAVVLACIGVYGIMAWAVAQRTSEIGVRLALGANPKQVFAMILREASWLSAMGLAIGLVVALMLARVIRSMLYGVAANDPLTFCGAAFGLMLVALGAGLIPARRAAMVQPMEALRHE